MSKEEWVESLLDDMVESQWSEDIIIHEVERLRHVEDSEPINRFSTEELEDSEVIDNDFKSQIAGLSKSDYEDYLIGRAIKDIRDDDYFDEIEFRDEYLEDIIRQHLSEEEDFLDMVMKEAIAEEEYFQHQIEQKLDEERYHECHEYHEDDEFHVVEYPVEKDVFDDLGDTSYMDQGIFEGADTDRLEEPFKYIYYEKTYFDEDLVDYSDDKFMISDYDQSSEYIDIAEAPGDITLDEPVAGVDLKHLIRERLIEEKNLDRIFVEIIKRDDYWDSLIRDKLASDEKLNAKIDKLH